MQHRTFQHSDPPGLASEQTQCKNLAGHFHSRCNAYPWVEALATIQDQRATVEAKGSTAVVGLLRVTALGRGQRLQEDLHM